MSLASTLTTKSHTRAHTHASTESKQSQHTPRALLSRTRHTRARRGLSVAISDGTLTVTMVSSSSPAAIPIHTFQLRLPGRCAPLMIHGAGTIFNRSFGAGEPAGPGSVTSASSQKVVIAMDTSGSGQRGRGRLGSGRRFCFIPSPWERAKPVCGRGPRAPRPHYIDIKGPKWAAVTSTAVGLGSVSTDESGA